MDGSVFGKSPCRLKASSDFLETGLPDRPGTDSLAR